jgi:hypothetical protein
MASLNRPACRGHQRLRARRSRPTRLSETVAGFDLVTHRRALEAASAKDLVVYQDRLLLIGRR